MKILIGNFIIKPCEASPTNWDVYEEVERQRRGTGTIAKPNGEKYKTEEVMAYGVSLNRALELITGKIVINENSESEFSISEYLNIYVEKKQELTDKLNEILSVNKLKIKKNE